MGEVGSVRIYVPSCGSGPGVGQMAVATLGVVMINGGCNEGELSGVVCSLLGPTYLATLRKKMQPGPALAKTERLKLGPPWAVTATETADVTIG
jgi:hypothetical protein